MRWSAKLLFGLVIIAGVLGYAGWINQYSTLRHERNSWDSAKRESSAKYEAAQASIENLQHRIEILQSQIRAMPDAQDQLAKIKSAIQQSNMELEEATRRRDEVVSGLTQAMQQKAAIETEAGRLSQLVAENQEALSKLQAGAKDAEARTDRLQKQRDRLHASEEQAKKEVLASQQQASAAKSELASIRSAIQKANAEMMQAKKRRDEAISAMVQAKEQQVAGEAEVGRLSELVTAKQQTLNDLQGKEADAAAEIARMKTERETLMASREQAKTELSALQTKLGEEKGKLDKFNSATVAAQKEVAILDAQIRDKKNEVSRLNDASERLQKNISANEQKLSNVKQIIESQKDAAKKAQGSLRELIKQVNDLSSKLENIK